LPTASPNGAHLAAVVVDVVVTVVTVTAVVDVVLHGTSGSEART